MKNKLNNNENDLKKMEDFFKSDLSIKNKLYKLSPKSIYNYDQDSRVKYGEELYNGLVDIEYELNNILNDFSFEKHIKDHINVQFKVYKDKVLNSGYDYNKLEKIYNIIFSNMDKELVDNVKDKCCGYTQDHDIYGLINDCNSINEILHVLHSSIVNNEKNYEAIPKLDSKVNDIGEEIILRGKETEVSRRIFDDFGIDIDCDKTDILSLKNKTLIMIRGKGHALSIEVDNEDDKYFVKYFIPKNCNNKMINQLKGVNKVKDDDKFATGQFGSKNLDNLSTNLFDFINKVPGDNDMFVEGGNFYKSSEEAR